MDDGPVRLRDIQPDYLIQSHAPGPRRIPIPTKSEVTAHSHPSTSTMRKSSPLIEHREGHIPQPQPATHRSDAGTLVNSDILEAPEVNDHGPVLPARARRGVRVAP